MRKFSTEEMTLYGIYNKRERPAILAIPLMRTRDGNTLSASWRNCAQECTD